MTEFTTKTRKTKYGYSVTVYEDGEFYSEVTAPTLEAAKREASHYVFVAEQTPVSESIRRLTERD